METNAEREQVFEALDYYLRDELEIDKLAIIEDLICDYTTSRNIKVSWMEIY